MKRTTLRRRIAAVLAVVTTALGVGVAAAGTAQAATYIYTERCGYNHYVNPASDPDANDVLAKTCVQTRRDTGSGETYFRTRNEVKLAPGVCCSRGIYITNRTAFVSSGPTFTYETTDWGPTYLNVITTDDDPAILYGLWTRTKDANNVWRYTGSLTTTTTASRNVNYTGATVFSSGTLTF